MKGKTCVITGATSGIGRAVVLELAARGASLILMGRNEVRGRKIVSYIRQQSPASNVQFVRCDLTLRRDVQEGAQQIVKTTGSVDVLIHNAGARFDTFGANPDGVERTFAGNHLGPFLLTALLFGSLVRAPAARVVIVGSSAHEVAPPDGWILTESNYDRRLAYGSSKLANIVSAYELARRLSGTPVTVNALDPGGVATRLGLNNGLVAWAKHIFYYLMKGKLLSPKRASAGVVYLAASPEVEGKSGGYYFENRLIRSSVVSYDRSLAKGLWQLSVDRSRITPEVVGSTWNYIAP